jgi:hypothetical protein
LGWPFGLGKPRELGEEMVEKWWKNAENDGLMMEDWGKKLWENDGTWWNNEVLTWKLMGWWMGSCSHKPNCSTNCRKFGFDLQKRTVMKCVVKLSN